jgi:hypothetical protein
MAWSISFPLQEHFTEKTLVGSFLAKKYDDLLISMGVRADFFTDILRDFAGYQQRFARDVKEMNDVVVAHGLPPISAMVLHQFLKADNGMEIVAMGEKLMAQAGMQVIPSSSYIEPNKGKVLTVSAWEGHPNEEAHRLFAESFRPWIEKAPRLGEFRLPRDAASAKPPSEVPSRVSAASR